MQCSHMSPGSRSTKLLYFAILMLVTGLGGIITGGPLITGIGVVLVILSLISFIPVMKISLETSHPQ